jgi:cephalosporin hydroxylase
MNEKEEFATEVTQNIRGLAGDLDLQALSRIWVREITPHKYAYNFTWLGRPIIQMPQDMMAVQEIVWRLNPELIIETGVAHGGSLIYSASLLELLGGGGRVLGIDIDIRAHNRREIEAHPLSRRIDLLEGSSIAASTVEQVQRYSAAKQRVLVILDSNHTHDHVLKELQLYSPLVRAGSYIIVFDTLIEDMPASFFDPTKRPWGKGNNPKTAVHEFLRTNDRFEIDADIHHKLLITVAPDGYLRCVKD